MSEKKIYFMHELPEAEQYAMSDSALREEAIKFERQNDPKEYRRMRSEGTLDEYAGLKARATRDYAETLISQGELPSHAWRRAMRVHIFEREED